MVFGRGAQQGEEKFLDNFEAKKRKGKILLFSFFKPSLSLSKVSREQKVKIKKNILIGVIRIVFLGSIPSVSISLLEILIGFMKISNSSSDLHLVMSKF